MPLGAWTIQEMRRGMKALDGASAKFVDIIYDTIGGNYRYTKEVIGYILKYYLEGSSSNESRPIHGLTLEQKTKLWNESSIGDGIVQERITDIRDDLEDIIEDLRKDKIDKMNLCISGTKMEGGGIDRLRSIYGSYQIRKVGGLKTRTSQFVASARLCRVRRSRITLDTIQQSLMIAKNSQRSLNTLDTKSFMNSAREWT